MTVVLALRCADGLVLGADSQITDSDRGLSYPARKLHHLGDHAAWGGSGAAMAQQAGALLAQYRMTERSVDHGVVAVMRVLDALDLTSPSIGGPMNVCRMTPDGAHHLDEKEVEQARERVRRWVELEQRALDELFS